MPSWCWVCSRQLWPCVDGRCICWSPSGRSGWQLVSEQNWHFVIEPRFVVWKHLDNFCLFLVNTKTSKNTKTIKSVKIKSQDSINSFKQNLIKQNWNNLNVEDVDVAYENFLVTVPDLFEKKNCPIVKKVVIKKYIEKPWITKWLNSQQLKKSTVQRIPT